MQWPLVLFGELVRISSRHWLVKDKQQSIINFFVSAPCFRVCFHSLPRRFRRDLPESEDDIQQNYEKEEKSHGKVEGLWDSLLTDLVEEHKDGLFVSPIPILTAKNKLEFWKKLAMLVASRKGNGARQKKKNSGPSLQWGRTISWIRIQAAHVRWLQPPQQSFRQRAWTCLM